MSDYFTVSSLTQPLGQDDVRRLALLSCLELHRVNWHRAYLASDGTRLFSWYHAPDGESLRLVLRQQGSPEGTIWLVDVDEEIERDPDGVIDKPGQVVIDFEFETPLDSEDITSKTKSVVALLRKMGCIVTRIFTSRNGTRIVYIANGEHEDPIAAYLHAEGHIPSAVWHCTEFEPVPEKLFGNGDKPTTRVDEKQRIESLSTPPTQEIKENKALPSGENDLDAVIIGAGISGICALQSLLGMGLKARVYDHASDVGGVWHWNRYPGARADSEAFTYGFSFSDELVNEWDWQELFADQGEMLRYLKYVVDRFHLRQHMHFNTRIKKASYDESGRRWVVESISGRPIFARYLIAATGTQSVPYLPDYEGVDSFSGISCHTARWPESGIDLSGKRVGVIGTGATGVQVIQTIAPVVKHLTVFQRTPTYCVPQRNRSLSDYDRRRIRDDWTKILAVCRESYGGFIHTFDTRSGLAVSEKAREEKFEELWQKAGFAFWFGNFGDLMMNADINMHASDFIRRKIRERVQDHDIVAKLLPNHPFGSKRIPLENGYYEAYNRDNVKLVDLRELSIERITPSGILTTREAYPLEVIVFATGFDTATGPLTRIDIRGKCGLTIEEKWRRGPKTFLGLLINGFPNFFIVNGPQNAAALCNAGRCIEQNVDWIARCIGYMHANNMTFIEPTTKVEDEWTQHVEDVADSTVLRQMKESWYFGANIPGKPRRACIYAAGAREFRKHCEDVERRGYPGVMMS